MAASSLPHPDDPAVGVLIAGLATGLEQVASPFVQGSNQLHLKLGNLGTLLCSMMFDKVQRGMSVNLDDRDFNSFSLNPSCSSDLLIKTGSRDVAHMAWPRRMRQGRFL